MHKSLIQQLKRRRLQLGLKQNDMLLRVGISRQQYQHLESKGNPRLDTLELIAKGLNSELMLIPKEKLNVVKAALENHLSQEQQNKQKKDILEDPWKDLLEDDQVSGENTNEVHVLKLTLHDKEVGLVTVILEPI